MQLTPMQRTRIEHDVARLLREDRTEALGIGAYGCVITEAPAERTAFIADLLAVIDEALREEDMTVGPIERGLQ